MPEHSWLDRAGVVVVALCGALAALIEVLLVPQYAGSVIFPIAPVLAVTTNVALPRLARALVPSALAALAPFASWLIVVIGFGLVTRPDGDVILPGGDLQWVTYALLFGGVLAGVITVASSAGREARAQGPSSGGRSPAAGSLRRRY